MGKKNIRNIAVILLALACFSVPASAASGNYTINDGETIPVSDSYLYDYSIDYIRGLPDGEDGYLNQPEDLYFDTNGNCLYIADTMNNRILKTTADGELIVCYSEANGKKFWQPKGVCVDAQGNLFVADTGNARIVKFGADGSFLREYGKPDSPLLTDIDVYSPTKVAVVSNGLIYVLMGEHIMCLDRENEMRGFIGQTQIGFSLRAWFIRTFASKEQKIKLDQEKADSYENFCLSDDGLIYASSRDTDEGQIKVLNSVGNNIYRKLSSVSGENTVLKDWISGFFSGNTISKTYSYGEQIDKENPVFSDICVDGNGIVTVVQKQNGRIYQYDFDGQLLASFGCIGAAQGEFAIPVSMVVDDQGKLYILDYSKANIQVFSPTEFIKKVHTAVSAYSNGDYTQSRSVCEEILKTNETYPLAHTIIANIAYKDGDWKQAMDGYRYTNDRQAYSKAFTEYRYDIMMDHYIWVFVGVAAAVVAAFLAITAVNRRSKEILIGYELLETPKLGFMQTLLLGMGVTFRPFRTMEALKNSRGRIGKAVPVMLFLLLFVTRLLFIYTVSYPLMDIEIKDVHLFLEFFKLVLPLLSWVAVVYLLSSQFDGESTFSENLTATSFALIPYIAVNLFAALISRFISLNEKGIFALLVNGVMIIMGLLLIISVNRLNDYSFGKTVLISAISFIAIFLLWFIVLLSYMCVTELIQFFRDIISEIQLT